MKLKLGLSNSVNVGRLGFPKSSVDVSTYSISGTVYDSDGTTAVSGATVAIGAASTTSAANGTYTISGLAAGTSGNLTCTKTGYLWSAITVSAMGGNLTNQNFISNMLYMDEFADIDDAPMTSPRTSEHGTWVITDTGNKLSTDGTYLNAVGKTANNNPTIIGQSGITRITGLTFRTSVHFQANYEVFGGFNDASTIGAGVNRHDFMQSHASILYWYNFGISESLSGTQDRDVYIVLRSTGNYCIFDNKLSHIQKVGSAATLYPFLGVNATDFPFKAGYARVAKLPTPWDTDYGFATQRVASPSTGQQISQLADALIEFTWTVATGETLEISFRYVDDNNRLICRCSQAGGTIKIIKVETGSETELNSAAQTWTNGSVYNIQLVMDGSTIKSKSGPLNNHSNKNSTTSTFNVTATTAKVAGFATGSDFVSYPRTISGDALTALLSISP